MNDKDFLLSSYDFALPEDLIAQHPSVTRGASRLFVLKRSPNTHRTTHQITSFAELAKLLPPKSLLVANNSKVIPARLQGQRETGGKFEFLLLTPLPLLVGSAKPLNGGDFSADNWLTAEAEGLLRPSKKLQVGADYALGQHLRLTVLEKKDFGQARVSLSWQGSLMDAIQSCGLLPLPPYIKREATPEDAMRYQTVYASDSKAGSVAAPTAGLHFTPEIKNALAEAGHEWAELTLFVGYGTFSPVRTEDIRQHEMHAEYVELTASTVAAIRKAKAEGRAVIAVGTTSTRVLEGIAGIMAEEAAKNGVEPEELLREYKGWLNCFIYPGREIHIIDGLITNFHLPQTSLLMLVSALAGREQTLRAYEEAIAAGMRFFSYGDAMLIL